MLIKIVKVIGIYYWSTIQNNTPPPSLVLLLKQNLFQTTKVSIYYISFKS